MNCNIGLHLQIGHHDIEAPQSIAAKASQPLQVLGQSRPLPEQYVYDTFLPVVCQPSLIMGIEVVPIAPVVCEVGIPLPADQPRFLGEELAVGHDAPVRHFHPLFPWAIHSLHKPVATGSEFLD